MGDQVVRHVPEVGRKSDARSRKLESQRSAPALVVGGKGGPELDARRKREGIVKDLAAPGERAALIGPSDVAPMQTQRRSLPGARVPRGAPVILVKVRDDDVGNVLQAEPTGVKQAFGALRGESEVDQDDAPHAGAAHVQDGAVAAGAAAENAEPGGVWLIGGHAGSA
jgi:hypothetical protein